MKISACYGDRSVESVLFLLQHIYSGGLTFSVYLCQNVVPHALILSKNSQMRMDTYFL